MKKLNNYPILKFVLYSIVYHILFLFKGEHLIDFIPKWGASSRGYSYDFIFNLVVFYNIHMLLFLPFVIKIEKGYFKKYFLSFFIVALVDVLVVMGTIDIFNLAYFIFLVIYILYLYIIFLISYSIKFIITKLLRL